MSAVWKVMPAALLLGAGPATGAVILNFTVPDVKPGDVAEGMRFLGDVEDFDVYRVATVDREPMMVAVRKGSKRLAAFFRPGGLQCFEGKFGGVPIACDQPRETALPPFKLPPSAGVGVPWLTIPPTGGIPPFVVPTHGRHTPKPPPQPEPPVGPPVEPPLPPVAPVPLPPSAILILLGLSLLGGLKLLKFAGEYESLRAQCCGDPDKAEK